MHTSPRLTRALAWTVLPLLALIGLSLPFAGPLAEGVFLGDDHPTNVFHLWFLRTHAGPFAPDPWNPYLNAGKPAYYLYPPGWLVVVWALDWATLRQLDLFALYRVLLFTLYLLPGVAVFLVLQRMKVDAALAVGWGVLANTLPIGHGHGDYGGFVMSGMLNGRLSWVLVPVALLGLARTFDPDRGPRASVLTGLVFGALALCHPWHTVVPALVACLWAAASMSGPARLRPAAALSRLALVGGIALCVTAWWLFPTLEQREFMRRGTLWKMNVLPIVRYWVRQHWALILTASLSALALRRKTGVARRNRDMLIAVPVLALLLVSILGVLQRADLVPMFEARRFKDDLILGLILLGGLGTGALVRPGRGRPLRIAAAALLVFASGWAGFAPKPWADLWATAFTEDPPVRWLRREIRPALNTDELWQALKGRPGRILFTAATIHAERGASDAHLMSLAPVFTGREIVNGTSTHHTPVSVFLQKGTSRGRIDALADNQDGRSLFGIPFSSREPADARRFVEACLALDVTDIVAHESEKRTLRFLDDVPGLRLRAQVGQFVIFERRAPMLAAGGWRLEGGRWRLGDGRLVLPYRAQAWTSGVMAETLEARPPFGKVTAVISVAFQRSWRLRRPDGTDVAVRESPEGLIEAPLAGADLVTPLVLDRRASLAPRLGRAVSGLALIAVLAVLLLTCPPRRGLRNQRSHQGQPLAAGA